MSRFAEALAKTPLVAILRGVTPDGAQAILAALIDAGFLIVEAPLNSPEPLKTIRLLRAAAPQDVVIGAGTVRTPADVEAVAEAGGNLIISPHFDAAIVMAAKKRGLIALPGVATPSEAFAALAAGADALKAFPAEMITPPVIKAWRAVIPADVAILPVGGVTPQSMADYVAAGASGFGLGSALYKPGDSAAKVAATAAAFITAWRKIRPAAKAKGLPRVQPWTLKIDAP
ncbi:MAG TPA: 2-dehydro-3-deoxy-6-phosphogalactonate aldolase [Roseiarcus sp.]|nr:2-dehydro-3-deoxy-6-phosphogalactonate aldolase [Roseiarcus sp.]